MNSASNSEANRIETVLNNPIRVQVQENGRIRHWGYVEDRDRYLQVIGWGDGA